MLDFYQNFPLYLNPVAFSIGSFAVRWYALSYLFGFGVVYLILYLRIKIDDEKDVAQIFNFKFEILNEKLGIQDTKYKIRDTIQDFLLLEFVAIILGGRLGYLLFYVAGNSSIGWERIFSPYDERGNFVGIFGMSYHGALLAAILAGVVFARMKKLSFWKLADFVSPAVAGGYFFGRIGNFLNGELYGRVTQSSWGMYFAGDFAQRRYPSQLLEAFFEGLVLFLLLWFFRNQKKFEAGFLFALYLFSYGWARLLVEFFREPDPQIGLLYSGLTLGQLFSLGMIIVGGLLLFFRARCKR